MRTNNADSRACRRWSAATVVLLVHLALLSGVLIALPPAPNSFERDAPSPAPLTWLRLMPAEQTAAPTAPAAPATPTSPTSPTAPTGPASPASPASPGAAPAPAPRPARLPVTPSDEPAISWLPVPNANPAGSPTPTPAPASPSAAAPAAEAPRPLNLSLPRAASAPWRNPALADPRSNTRALTLEGRLAQIMGPGDGPLMEEALPDGGRRFSRGNNCVILRPSRAGALDPFNNSVSPMPRQADNC